MADPEGPTSRVSRSDTAGRYNVGQHGSYFSASESRRLAKRFGFPDNFDLDDELGSIALFFELRIANPDESATEIRKGLVELRNALSKIDAALTATTFAKMEALGGAQNAPKDATINEWLAGLHQAVKRYGRPLERLAGAAVDALPHGRSGRVASAAPRRSLVGNLVDLYERQTGKRATVTTNPIDSSHSGPAYSFVIRSVARIRAVSMRSGADRATHCLSVSLATIAADMKLIIRDLRAKEGN